MTQDSGVIIPKRQSVQLCQSWSQLYFNASIIHGHRKCGFVGLAQEDDIATVNSAYRAADAIVKDVGSVSKSAVTDGHVEPQ